MDNFKAEVQALIIEYGYTDVANLCVNLAIETYQGIRNYPDSFTEAEKILDMEKSISKIAMAAIEIDAKVGVENQTEHSESGITRKYSKNLLAYATVIPFVRII